MKPETNKIELRGDPQSTVEGKIQLGKPIVPVERTFDLPEPPLEEIEKLISDKPLRFHRPPMD